MVVFDTTGTAARAIVESWMVFALTSGASPDFNSVAVIDADGEVMGIYRETHIPHSPGYCEKYYFAPGDTGPRVWRTLYATIGVGICWDQWFPELARAMALMGAEIVLYPSATGAPRCTVRFSR